MVRRSVIYTTRRLSWPSVQAFGLQSHKTRNLSWLCRCWHETLRRVLWDRMGPLSWWDSPALSRWSLSWKTMSLTCGVALLHSSIFHGLGALSLRLIVCRWQLVVPSLTLGSGSVACPSWGGDGEGLGLAGSLAGQDLKVRDHFLITRLSHSLASAGAGSGQTRSWRLSLLPGNAAVVGWYPRLLAPVSPRHTQP